MGRPPIGERAMTAAEKQRRYRARKFGNKPRVTKSALAAEIAALKQQLAQAHKRIAELERRGELTRGRRDSGQTGAAVFSEVGKLRAEIVKLKFDIIKRKAMLQEEPDAAKLRKKVVDQQVEMTSMRAAMKRIAKERDKYRAYAKPKYREARGQLTRENYNVIIKALHADRLRHCTPTELATAHRLVTALRPLFDEG
jgi:hypothetical protein